MASMAAENPSGGATFGIALLAFLGGGVAGYLLQPTISKMLTPAASTTGTQGLPGVGAAPAMQRQAAQPQRQLQAVQLDPQLG